MELERLQKQISLLQNAYMTLETAFQQDSFSALEKDGVIQRFEYNIELSWKTCKKYLEYEKVNFISSPREVLKQSFQLQLISDLLLWNRFLDIRNSLSHIYSENHSEESFLYIQDNYKQIQLLIQNLNFHLSDKS